MPRKIEYTEELRVAVESGARTIAEIADHYGVSRQSIFAAFKRRNWATTTSGGLKIQPQIDAKAVRDGVEAKEAQSAIRQRPSTETGPAGLQTPPSAPSLFLPATTDDETAEIIQANIVNSGMLVLHHCGQLLAGPRLSPNQLKSIVTSMAETRQLFKDVGVNFESNIGQPELIIREMTADEVMEMKAAAERGDTQLAHDAAESPAEVSIDTGQAAPVPAEGPLLDDGQAIDFERLERELAASLQRKGNATWRSWATANGLDAPRDRSALKAAIVEAAHNNRTAALALQQQLRAR